MMATYDENDDIRVGIDRTIREAANYIRIGNTLEGFRRISDALNTFTSKLEQQILVEVFFNTPGLVNNIRIALTDEQDPEVRTGAANIIADFGIKEAEGDLLKVLKDRNSSVRRASILSLGRLKSRQAVRYLVDAIQDVDPMVRGAAAWALGEIGGELTYEILSDTLSDDDVEVRTTAVQALEKIGDRRTIDPLIEMLQRDEDAKVRAAAAWALGEFRSRDAMPALINSLMDKDAGVRWSAVWALGEIKNIEALGQLVITIEDNNDDVRAATALALGRIGDQATDTLLLAALNDEIESVRIYALVALILLKSPGTVESIRDFIIEQGSTLHFEPYELVDFRVEEASIDFLKKILVDVPEDAAKRVGRFFNEIAIPADITPQEPRPPIPLSPETPLEATVLHADTPATEDLLGGGRQGFANALGVWLSRFWKEMVQSGDRSLLVHLHGEWGAGKTSMLNLLKNAVQPVGNANTVVKKQQPLKKEIPDDELRWVVVRFNAWQQQHIKPVWWPLMDQVYRQSAVQLTSHFRDKKRSCYLKITNWWWRFKTGGHFSYFIGACIFLFFSIWFIPNLIQVIAPVGEPPLSASAGILKSILVIISFAGTIWTTALYISKSLLLGSANSAEAFLNFGKDPLETIRKYYGEMLDRIHQPVIVYIDDLDRCNQEYVVAIFEVLNNLFSNARAFYVIAADREWLYACFESVYMIFADGLQQPGRRLGYLFLQKSFQLSVKVPMISEEVVKAYIEAMSKQGKEELANSIKGIQEKAKEAFQNATSEEEIIKTLDKTQKGTIEDQVYRSAAVRQTAKREVEAEAEVYLRDFAHLLEPNPRSIKRLVNAYGIYRALAILAGVNTFDPERKEQFVLWIILSLRWPLLAEFLEGQPEMVDVFVKNTPNLKMPEGLQPLIGDINLVKLIKGREGQIGLNANAIKRFRGIAGF